MAVEAAPSVLPVLVWSLVVEVLCGSDMKVVTVEPGDDASLRCDGPRAAAISLVAWSRPDLKTDKYVFFYRDQRSIENYQLPRFRGRVALRDPLMKDGDASVVLKNVTHNDTGTYECRIMAGGGGHSKRGDPEPVGIITLSVVDPGRPDGNMAALTALSLFACTALVLAAAVGGAVVIYRRLRPR